MISGVTAEMIKSKEKEIHNIFKPPKGTTSSQIDVSTSADQSQLPEGGQFFRFSYVKRRGFCKGLFDSDVTAEMIKKTKEKEIHNMFKSPKGTTSSQIDVSTSADQSQLSGGNSFDSKTSYGSCEKTLYSGGVNCPRHD